MKRKPSKKTSEQGMDDNLDIPFVGEEEIDALNEDIGEAEVEVSEEESESPSSNDPAHEAISQRTADLSRSIINPVTLARKIRESVVEIAGRESANLYHISGNYDAQKSEWQFSVSRLSPNFLTQLEIDEHTAKLDLAYVKELGTGWKIAVGVTASKSWDVPDSAADLKGGFTVSVSR